MAGLRHRFGGADGDWAFSQSGPYIALQSGVSVTFYTALTGGTQVTDLQNTSGGAITSVTTNSNGEIPEFYGPAGVAKLAADANGGSGPRRWITANDTGKTPLWCDVTAPVFGAVGDGSTDDLAAITAAITAAQAAGGTVYFPGGYTFLVSGTPQVTGSNVIMRGDGASSVILLAPASMTANGHTIGIWVNGGSNITIEDLCIDGNFANIAKDGGTVVPSTFGGGTAALGAAVVTAPAAGTTETWTVNAAASAASAAYSTPFAVKADSEFVLVTGGYGTTSWTVKRGFGQGNGGGATATHSNGAGIGSTSTTLFDATITAYGSGTPKTYMSSAYAGGVDASTYLQYRMPVRISNADNVTVRNCLIRNSVSAGVLANSASVNGCSSILVTNCRIRLTWDNGVYFHQGIQYATATGNTISDTMYNGVSAVYCDHVLVTGNNIRQAGPSFSDSGGTQINGSSNCLVQGNLFDQCQFYGAEVLATQETNITNGAGGNSVWAANTVITGNNITSCHANDYPTHTAAGINIFGARDTNMNDNTIDNCDYGISMGAQAVNAQIQSNRITRSKSLGINVGNNADVTGITIKGNFIGYGLNKGAFVNGTGTRFENNTFLANQTAGVDVAGPPAGVPAKTDWFIGNTFQDNNGDGLKIGPGAGSLAIVKGNTFGNSGQVIFSDGVTNGTTTFTSATAAFAGSDAGKVLVIMDQGTGGTTTTTTIASVTNGTTVVLNATPPGSGQAGLLFWIGRGPAYYSDGSTDTSQNTVLTSATAGFTTAADAGKLVVVMTTDPQPRVLWSGTIASVTSSTQAVLNGTAGAYPAVAFTINRSQGQQTRAINNSSGQLIDLGNTVYSIPELLTTASATSNIVRTPVPGFPTGGLTAYWKFDEGTGSTIYDDTNGPNSGTWNGTLGSQWAAGKIGPGGNLNGTDNFADCGADASQNITTAITVSMWLNPATQVAQFAAPFAKGGAYWSEGDSGLTNKYNWYIHTTIDNNIGQVQLTAGVWQHLVLTYDGTTAIIYLNGNQSVVTALSGAIGTTANHLLLGNRTGFSRFYKGGIDEAGLWSRALTPKEVAALYNFGGGVQHRAVTSGLMT